MLEIVLKFSSKSIFVKPKNTEINLENLLNKSVGIKLTESRQA